MKKIILLATGLLFFSAIHAQEKIHFGVQRDRMTSSNRKADSVRALLIKTDTTTKKPLPKKPAGTIPKKPADPMELKRND